MTRLKAFPAFALLLLASAPAFAHPGHGPASGFANGFLHPFGGIDHLAAMIAVGLWAAQRGGRAVWTAPLAFLSMMALGGAAGMAGFPLPFVEQGVAASVLVLGVLIAAASRLTPAAGVALIGSFAVFHGLAHAAEMPLTASGVDYGAGFIAATELLHACGIAAGLVLNNLGKPRVLRWAGAAIALGGVALVLTR
jgi:urease accessory protein